jgi:hypothetical protein
MERIGGRTTSRGSGNRLGTRMNDRGHISVNFTELYKLLHSVVDSRPVSDEHQYEDTHNNERHKRDARPDIRS